MCDGNYDIYIQKKLERKRMRKVCKRGLAKRSKKKVIRTCVWVGARGEGEKPKTSYGLIEYFVSCVCVFGGSGGGSLACLL